MEELRAYSWRNLSKYGHKPKKTFALRRGQEYFYIVVRKAGEKAMAVKTVVREGENIDEALRRFKRGVNKSGILLETRKREAYLKPALMRKMKQKFARRKKF